MRLNKLNNLKNWFNTQHNQISIYNHYSNRKRINKITWRLFWINLIIFSLYLILLASIYPSEPNHTTTIGDRIPPIDSFLISLVFIPIFPLLIIFAFTVSYNKNNRLISLESTKPLSNDQKSDIRNILNITDQKERKYFLLVYPENENHELKNDIIDTLSEILEGNN